MHSDKLTETRIQAEIRKARGAGKAIKISDGKGLYLLLKPSGAVLWRFKYFFEGRENLLSLDAYPAVSLKAAREKRDAARKLVANGRNPSAVRRAERLALADSVKAVGLEWLAKQTTLDPSTIEAHRRRLEKFIFPYLGQRPIAAVTAPDLLSPLRRIEAAKKLDTARRTRELCGKIWRYAIATGRAEHDISQDLRGALAPPSQRHHAAITDPKRVGELLRAIDSYQGQPTTQGALKLGPLTFVRPGELRHAEWSEFDFAGAMWRISAEKMKMEDTHLVPLSRQAIAVLREVEPHTSTGKYVFPSLRSIARPMSENTVNAALRRLDYSGDEQVGHGFRTIASTMLNEMGWHPDLIELQLAHKERNKSRASYNKALRLDERRKMMQAWADHLDSLRASRA